MEKYFNYRSGRIFYTDQGEGVPVIFIHGYLETSGIWSDFVREITADYRVITIDLPGHGRSDIYGDIHTMDFMAGVIRGLIDDLGMQRVIMIGHSMGGYVTLAFTELFPDLLAGYCLFHSHPFQDSPETIEKREMEIKMLEEGNKEKILSASIPRLFASSNLKKFKEAVRQSLRIAGEVPQSGITAVLRGMMARPSRLDVLEHGRVPCLWILGAMDNHINYEQVLTKVSLPANTEVVVLRRSGHMGFAEERKRSVQVIVDFIEKVK